MLKSGTLQSAAFFRTSIAGGGAVPHNPFVEHAFSFMLEAGITTNTMCKSFSQYIDNPRGQVTGVSGPATYPLGYIYDSYGQMSELHTYRLGPPSPSSADITTWTYDNATGLLTSKTDPKGKSVTYTYDSANRLSTRTWARSVGAARPLVTNYSYSSATGELTSVAYTPASATCPDITYTYNRLGQQLTVADAVGTRTFTYNAALQPQSEAITGMYNKTINRSYATTGMVGRYTGMTVAPAPSSPAEYAVSYAYDSYGRFGSVTSGSDTFTYTYLANSNLVSSITYPNTITVTNAYESNRNLIDYVENKHNTTTISKYDYTNDALGRRTAMEKSGTAFTATDTINYSYNDRSEVTGADAVTDANYNFGFDYDPIGNRKTYDTTESGSNVQSVYSANNLNQYTNITNPTQSPTYDDDGSMLTMTLTSGSWTNTFNAENRLVSMVKGTTTIEFKYDYKGRRVEKKVTESSSVTKQERFVYDGHEQIEKLDALNSSAIVQKFVWQDEQLLAVNNGTDTYYYTLDANKNVSELLDNTGSIVGHYEYSPFGKVIASIGSYKDDNPFRFSSEYADDESGLVYYNYRYYSAELGRWLSRDPIKEEAFYLMVGQFEKEENVDNFESLYGFVSNNPVTICDSLGLVKKEENKRCECCIKEVPKARYPFSSIESAAKSRWGNQKIEIQKAKPARKCELGGGTHSLVFSAKKKKGKKQRKLGSVLCCPTCETKANGAEYGYGCKAI